MGDEIKRRSFYSARKSDGPFHWKSNTLVAVISQHLPFVNPAPTYRQAKIMKLTNKNLLAFEDGDDSAGGGNQQQEDDNISVARTALSEGGRSVRSIHSTRSLAAVAERARVGIVSARGAGGGNGTGTAPARLEKGLALLLNGESNDRPVNDIVVVTHQDDGGLRLGGKNTVSNLPYIRRNPAI